MHTITRASVSMAVTFGILLAVTIYGVSMLAKDHVRVVEGVVVAFHNVETMFLVPGAKHFTIFQALYDLAITVGLAVLTTVIGAAAALVLGLFGAQNLSNRRVSSVIKSVMSVFRAVPTVLWVLIFAIGAGLGSVAAVIGMSFHSTSYLMKAYSESFEEIDRGVIEALRASGASWIQIVVQAVLPSSVNPILSWTFIRFEINFANAVAMGAAAGAGGIGYSLFWAGTYYYNLHEVGFITYLILAVAIVLEYSATSMRSRFSVNK
ncbi:MAG: PhnE/PtxC family ABC transporter permease [Spirochaetia bacterium]